MPVLPLPVVPEVLPLERVELLPLVDPDPDVDEEPVVPVALGPEPVELLLFVPELPPADCAAARPLPHAIAAAAEMARSRKVCLMRVS
jgi:hypothetical protein